MGRARKLGVRWRLNRQKYLLFESASKREKYFHIVGQSHAKAPVASSSPFRIARTPLVETGLANEAPWVAENVYDVIVIIITMGSCKCI